MLKIMINIYIEFNFCYIKVILILIETQNLTISI